MRPNDLGPFWLPYTPNRSFKANPRMLVRAEGMYFYDETGRALLDTCAGLWCVNAGHGRKPIVEAIRAAAGELDFAPTFQFGHPAAFALAQRIAALAPEGMDHVFFVNSGSEAADSALKIARAYFQKIGQGGRFRLIGREKGYHGTTFAGISVGGLGNNRRPYGPLLPGTDDHLPLPYDRARMAFTKGEPEGGAEYADALEQLVALHGAETIAAVIVEPMAGSAGVFATPKDYLKRLRALCDKYGILLIFDEVITGFGRLGTPFATEYFGVTPDLVTSAKGITNGVIPMGAVFASRKIHDALMVGPTSQIELFHGYTYSAHPVACAAGLATLDIYEDEGLLTRGASLAGYWSDAFHQLKDLPNVIDIRTVGLMGAVELSPRKDAPGARGYELMVDCFNRGLYFRQSGDAVALSPPLIVERSHIDEMVSILGDAIKRVA